MGTSAFTFENLYRAYLACRKNKRSSPSALRFEVNAEERLWELAATLQARSYRPLPSVCFITESPKPREIFAADFQDRIVHHLLVSLLEPAWERVFIHDSYACRRGKGTHAAVDRLQSFMQKVSANGSRPAYYLKADIRSFFVSINKQILYDVLCRKEEREELRWLLQTVIFHDPTIEHRKRGQLFSQIPSYKSLFSTGNRAGLPIGNYTSQFFANVYLDALDQFVKHTLRCRFYLRYVDDLILLSNSRSELEGWETKIEGFLRERLALELNPRRRILASISNGCDALGYLVKRTHRKPPAQPSTLVRAPPAPHGPNDDSDHLP